MSRNSIPCAMSSSLLISNLITNWQPIISKFFLLHIILYDPNYTIEQLWVHWMRVALDRVYCIVPFWKQLHYCRLYIIPCYVNPYLFIHYFTYSPGHRMSELKLMTIDFQQLFFQIQKVNHDLCWCIILWCMQLVLSSMCGKTFEEERDWRWEH